MTTKKEIKELCLQAGADLVGIASVESFTGAPEGVHPKDVLPSCKSIVVLCCEFPAHAEQSDSKTHTTATVGMIVKMNKMAADIAEKLREAGHEAHAIESLHSSTINNRESGPISLKHAAIFAGLGKIGKNTLLVNKKYGNMIWLNAVLTSLPLESDQVTDEIYCQENCSACIQNCPVAALGGEFMNQSACKENAFKTVDGELDIQCWKCREMCPNHYQGITQ